MLTSSDAEEEIEDSQEQRERKLDGWMGQQKEGVIG